MIFRACYFLCAAASSFLFLSMAGCSEESNGSGPSSTGGTGGTAAVTGGAASGGTMAASGGTVAATGGSAATGGTAGSADAQTMYVEGSELFDRCGEKIVLRGVNEMVVWSPGKDGDPEFSEIAKTGANAVRIVWNEEGTAAELDTAIENALAQQLIPMIEHHSATGDLSALPTVVDYWVQPDVVAVIQKYEADLLLNIANEAGDGSVTAATFSEAYKTAISRIRDTGVVLPLVIDAPQWGQNIDVIQATWQELTEHDPQHNLLFSVHMWWNDPDGTRVRSEITESVDAGMPFIVGEFAQHAVANCDQDPFAYEVLLEEAQAEGIGWLAWSWGGVDNSDCADEGSFDMTVGGVYGEWEEPWGESVAVTHAASITNTSVRPTSITTGTCQ